MTKGKGLRSIEPALRKTLKSRVTSTRPVCPVCGQRAPHPHDVSADLSTTSWAEPYGHRCPHDVPCLGFGTKYVGAACTQEGCKMDAAHERAKLKGT